MLAAALVAIAMAPTTTADRPLEAVYRAAKALQIVQSDSQLTLERLAERLEPFALEVSIAKDRAASESDVVLKRYEAALAAYSDAKQLWQDVVEFKRLIGGDAPCAKKCEEKYVAGYAIEGLTKRQAPGARSASYRAAEVLPKLLAIAADRIDEANRAFLGR